MRRESEPAGRAELLARFPRPPRERAALEPHTLPELRARCRRAARSVRRRRRSVKTADTPSAPLHRAFACARSRWALARAHAVGVARFLPLSRARSRLFEQSRVSGMRAPKAQEIPAAGAVARRGGPPAGIAGRRPRWRCATRRCSSFSIRRDCVSRSSRASRRRTSTSADATVRVTGKGAKTRVVPVGARRSRRSKNGWACARALKDMDRSAVRESHWHAPDRARMQYRMKQWALKQGLAAQRASARAAPFVRLARAAIERRPARSAGNAGPREHFDDAGVYPSRLSAPGQGLRRGASAREAKNVRRKA